MRILHRNRWLLLRWPGHSCLRQADSKITLAGNCYRQLVLWAMLAFATQAVAQRASAPAAHAAGPTHSAVPHLNSSGNFAVANHRHPSAFRRSSPYVSPYGSLPFFGDSFNPDDIYSSGYPVASEPPPFLMQAMRDMAGSAANPMAQVISPPANHQPAANDPLMIELQNGRYVRVDNSGANGDALPLNLTPNRARSSSTTPTITASAPSRTLPPAVLVFHDGHSEEVRDYTIADGMLYARGDYYTDGYWNKKIDLATLNVAETMQANASRSVKFTLPSSPNEVITRP
jgi:hypothetical protein